MMGGAKTLPAMMGVLLAFVAVYFVVMICTTVAGNIKKKKRNKERMEMEKEHDIQNSREN